LELKSKLYLPDFLLYDNKGNFVIFEHFGMSSLEYKESVEAKKEEYSRLIQDDPTYSFIFTDENDMWDLKKNLSQKLNGTPLKKPYWQ
jgi:hypothetical protein